MIDLAEMLSNETLMEECVSTGELFNYTFNLVKSCIYYILTTNQTGIKYKYYNFYHRYILSGLNDIHEEIDKLSNIMTNDIIGDMYINLEVIYVESLVDKHRIHCMVDCNLQEQFSNLFQSINLQEFFRGNNLVFRQTLRLIRSVVTENSYTSHSHDICFDIPDCEEYKSVIAKYKILLP